VCLFVTRHFVEIGLVFSASCKYVAFPFPCNVPLSNLDDLIGIFLRRFGLS